MDEIKLGAAYSFMPEAFINYQDGPLPGGQAVPRRVTGRITYINHAHRYFRVTYEVNGVTLSESFKF